MEELNIERETEVATITKAIPEEKIKKEKVKKEKAKETLQLKRLFPVLIMAMVLFAGFNYYRLQQKTDQLREQIGGLQRENEAKDQSVASLSKEAQSREEELLRLRGEADQFKGQLETVRLALMEREGQIARLQQIAPFREKLPKKVKGLQMQLVQKQIENVSFQKTVSDQSAWLRSLAAPTAQMVRMTGSKEAGSAGGMVLFDPKSQTASFYGFDLPKLPPGKTYQFWMIGAAPGTVPISAGLFFPSGDRTAVVKSPKIGKTEGLKGFSVTLEPIGGKRQPTGPVYFSGSLPPA